MKFGFSDLKKNLNLRRLSFSRIGGAVILFSSHRGGIHVPGDKTSRSGKLVWPGLHALADLRRRLNRSRMAINNRQKSRGTPRRIGHRTAILYSAAR